MGQEIGQTSPYQPAVVFDGYGVNYYMVFSANDSSNRILYATSPDGQNWTLGLETGETSGAAPALALYQIPGFSGSPDPNYLVLVFVANDASNRVLYATLNLNAPGLGWMDQGQVGEETAHAVFAFGTTLGSTQPSPSVTVYFTSNDSSNNLLEHQFIP